MKRNKVLTIGVLLMLVIIIGTQLAGPQVVQ